MNAENGNFSKITYAGTPYRETNMYLSTQPLDKRVKGFGSKDAHRRDEFTSAIRTEQYRESMRKELKLYKSKNQSQELPPIDDRASTAPASFGTRTEMLYDIGRTKVTEFDPKSTKDCFYRTTLEREKRLGPYRPTSTNIGESAWKTEYKPPAHGAASLVKVYMHMFLWVHFNVVLEFLW